MAFLTLPGGDTRPLPRSRTDAVLEALADARCPACGSRADALPGAMRSLRVRCRACGAEFTAPRPRVDATEVARRSKRK